MGSLDHSSDAIDLVTTTKCTALGVIEDCVFVKDLIDCGATTHGIIFAKYVAQITKQQGRYAVGHGYSRCTRRGKVAAGALGFRRREEQSGRLTHDSFGKDDDFTATVGDPGSEGENAFGFAKNAHDVRKSFPCRELEDFLWSYLIVQRGVAISPRHIDEREMSLFGFLQTEL